MCTAQTPQIFPVLYCLFVIFFSFLVQGCCACCGYCARFRVATRNGQMCAIFYYPVHPCSILVCLTGELIIHFMYLLVESLLKISWKNLSSAVYSCSLQGQAVCWSPVIQRGLIYMFLGTGHSDCHRSFVSYVACISREFRVCFLPGV